MLFSCRKAALALSFLESISCFCWVWSHNSINDHQQEKKWQTVNAPHEIQFKSQFAVGYFSWVLASSFILFRWSQLSTFPGTARGVISAVYIAIKVSFLWQLDKLSLLQSTGTSFSSHLFLCCSLSFSLDCLTSWTTRLIDQFSWARFMFSVLFKKELFW